MPAKTPKPDPRVRFRYERFGGIIVSDEPPLLAHVDQDYMTGLGLPPSPQWSLPERDTLSAPVEAHMLATRRCPLACQHCYTNSSPTAGQDLSTAEFKARIDALAAQRVFHLALGGGEAFLRDDLMELARYARERGLTPSLTTNGLLMTPELAADCARLFGQVNVSVDSLSRDLFGEPKTAPALSAAAMLKEAGARVGFNVVVTRQNFDELPEIVAKAAEMGLYDLEFLRFKPRGRGRHQYQQQRMTEEQGRMLFPKVLEWTQVYGIAIKLDCASAPFIAYHEPDLERMQQFDIVGCIGGVSLLGVDERGQLSACSFYPQEPADVLELESFWEAPESFEEFRERAPISAEPCRSCTYRSICRGGCRAVARFVTGQRFAPDPECPRVLASQRALEV